MKYYLLFAAICLITVLNISCTKKTEPPIQDNLQEEFFTAVKYNDVARMAQLLDAGVDIEIKNGDGNTALMEAVLRGKKESVELLLEKGADINAEDKNGTPVLVNAVREMNFEIIELLIKTYEEITASDYSNNRQDIYVDIIRLLLKNYASNESVSRSVSKIEDDIYSELESRVKTVYIREEVGAETVERIKVEIKQELMSEIVTRMEQQRAAQAVEKEQQIELLRITDIIE